MKQVYSEKQIVFNLVTYVLAWATFCVTYSMVFLKIESVGGTLFFNVGIISILEFSGTFIGSWIGGKYNDKLGDILRYIMIFDAVLSALFLLAPTKDISPLIATLMFFSIASIKLGSDLVNNLICLYSPKAFTLQYVGIYLAFSRLLSRLILYQVPTINSMLEKNGIHPFIFISFLWSVCAVLSLNAKQPKDDPVSSQALYKRRSSSKILKVLVEEEEEKDKKTQ